MSANDRQVGGSHYSSRSIQPWDYIIANNLGFLEGSIIKYVTRYKEKGGVKDLEKARHFLDKLIEGAQPKELSLLERRKALMALMVERGYYFKDGSNQEVNPETLTDGGESLWVYFSDNRVPYGVVTSPSCWRKLGDIFKVQNVES